MASLDADRGLLAAFIRWSGVSVPTGRLTVLEQSLPDEPSDVAEMDEAERRGLPDGWIYDKNGWALLIESKVSAGASDDQIQRHLRMARIRGCERPNLLWLTVLPISRRLAPGVVNQTWTEVYAWLVKRGTRSEWASRAAQYFEVAEVQADMKSQLREGALTRFTGVPFGHRNPYIYTQAKRLLGLMRDKLRGRKDLRRVLNINPDCPGRGAITGRASTLVWDFISTRTSKRGASFTQNIHLTLGIHADRVDAYVTVPNNVPTGMRVALLGEEYNDFHAIVANATRRLDRALKRYKGARPQITLVQRRYATQNSPARHDALLRFDPRTAVPVRWRGGERPVLFQPQWLIATEQVLRNRKSNLQLQVGAEFPYSTCSITRSDRLIDAVAEVWLACEPVIMVLAGDARPR